MTKTKGLLLSLLLVLVSESIWLFGYLSSRLEDIEIVGGALLLIGTAVLAMAVWILFRLRGAARVVLGPAIGLVALFLLFFSYVFLVRW